MLNTLLPWPTHVWHQPRITGEGKIHWHLHHTEAKAVKQISLQVAIGCCNHSIPPRYRCHTSDLQITSWLQTDVDSIPGHLSTIKLCKFAESKTPRLRNLTKPKLQNIVPLTLLWISVGIWIASEVHRQGNSLLLDSAIRKQLKQQHVTRSRVSTIVNR
jgi:hypothetical protein